MPRFSARERDELLAIKAACYRDLGRAELLAVLGDRLGAYLRADATCMAELDPSTGYPVSSVSHVWPDENHEPLIERALLRSPAADPGWLLLRGIRSVIVESLVPDGDWRRDPYFAYHLLPYGYRHELQVACAAGHAVWALLTISRKESTGSFDARVLRLLDAIAPHVAAGMRAAATREALMAPAGSGVGFVLLDDHGRVELANRVAERWLRAAPRPGHPSRSWALQVFAGLFVRALREEGALDVPSLEVADPHDGAAYRLSGERTVDVAGRPRILIVLEPVRAADRTARLTRLGLTEREAEVTLGILRGETAEQIALRARISTHTVQTHLKHVFSKLDVSSRSELAVRVYGRF